MLSLPKREERGLLQATPASVSGTEERYSVYQRTFLEVLCAFFHRELPIALEFSSRAAQDWC
jgi:hypothetical protein